MAIAGEASQRDILASIDAGTGALARHDLPHAVAGFARASELLFQQAAQCSNPSQKLELAKRAGQLLKTVHSLQGVPASADESGTAGVAPGAPGSPSTVPGAGPRLHSGIGFSHVAGLESVKETLRLRVIYPLKHPEKLAQYGLRAGGGLLLYGPPGTGKTMVAKALAGELDIPFFAIKPSEVLSKWFGESEQKLGALFNEARQHQEGAVIFVDEIDAIGASRRESNASEASRRLLTQLLQELDGVNGRPARLLFLAATNEPWLLDDALLRPGRFDEKCYVPLPDEPARRALLELQLAGCAKASDLDLAHAARATDGFSGADLMCLCERAKQIPFREAVLNGLDRPLGRSDLETALAGVRPSVSRDLLKRYEDYDR